jgi:hypothetical protein
MASNRAELAQAILHLKDNVNFRHYVTTLETLFNDRVTALLLSDHPDEALRGECRALRAMILNINKATGDLT